MKSIEFNGQTLLQCLTFVFTGDIRSPPPGSYDFDPECMPATGSVQLPAEGDIAKFEFGLHWHDGYSNDTYTLCELRVFLRDSRTKELQEECTTVSLGTYEREQRSMELLPSERLIGAGFDIKDSVPVNIQLVLVDLDSLTN